MGTTDAKPGFRLPWSADRGEAGDPVETSAEGSAEIDPLTASADAGTDTGTSADVAPEPAEEPVGEAASDDAADAAAGSADTTSDPMPLEAPAPEWSDRPAPRKPNKFMADLTKAMQVAATSARDESLTRFAAEAKTHIEQIHADTANEAVELRKRADDDIATIREWSKAEIARIREETDERISHRKTVLEHEVEGHAAGIESRIDLVQQRVVAFETEMSTFFDRLLAEEDPTRFASMAENMPEPPPFSGDAEWEPTGLIGVEEGTAGHDRVPVEDNVVADTADEVAPEAAAEAVSAESSDPGESDAGPTEWSGEYVDPLAGIAEPDAEGSPEAGIDAIDPRLAALPADADLAAAEAEAADYPSDAAVAEADDDVPTIAEDALAARLVGLVPEAASEAAEQTSTNVIVTGLISVASIAGFKRHLSRVPGVGSVGVSSGPDGEFIFAVGHTSDLTLGDAITTLPGFGARVVGDREGELTVTARDPEADG